MCLVVIVDDRATNRAIYQQLARSIDQNVRVRAFGDPAEALAWLVDNQADLIVTDYDMPRIVGDEFISRFRALPHASGVPIMMVTVCDRRQLRLRALESGATDFLQAPVDHFEFLTRARNLLKLSRSAAARGASACAQDCGESPAAEAEEEAAAPPPEPDDGWDEETRGLLGRCGPSGYAFHYLEITPSKEAFDLTPALRRLLRGDDLAIRVDSGRYFVLQKNVGGAMDARALTRRLTRVCADFAGHSLFRIGMALPGADARAPRQRAADCLRAARRSAQAVSRIEVEGGASDKLRLAPIVDLPSGGLAGVQMLIGNAPAVAGDSRALRAALCCAADAFLGAGDEFRISLRLELESEASESIPLRLPPLLAETGVEPSRLDLILDADQLASAGARARPTVGSLKALGVGLSLQIGDKPEIDEAAALLRIGEGAGERIWPDAIRLTCASVKDVQRMRALCSLLDRTPEPPPFLLADGVPSTGLLSQLRKAGASRGQGACFGAPFALRELELLLLAARSDAASGTIQAARA